MTSEGSGPLIWGGVTATAAKVMYVVRKNDADNLVVVDEAAPARAPPGPSWQTSWAGAHPSTRGETC